MADEREQYSVEEENPFDTREKDVVKGVVDEFINGLNKRQINDLSESERIEATRATLSRITRSIPLEAGSASRSEEDSNLLVRKLSYLNSAVTQDIQAGLAAGEINASNADVESRKVIVKNQNKLQTLFSKFVNFAIGRKNQEEEDDLRSREAFSFVTAEMVRIMGEIFQSMDFSSEEESSVWKKFRISLSTTTLLPLTLLQVLRNIPIAESFHYLQDKFWLRRISRAWVVDRHGTLEKGKKPPDRTLQADGSSHTSFTVHAPETRNRLQKLEQSEQFAIRLFSTLSFYSGSPIFSRLGFKGQDTRGEEFKLIENVGGVSSHTIKVGFRTKDRFYKIVLTADEILAVQSSSEKTAQFIAELARIIESIQSSPDGKIEVPFSQNEPPKVIESVTLSGSAQQLLQKHAYEGRADLNAVDEALLEADVCLLLDPEVVGVDESKVVQRADYITGGSHMKEVIIPLVDAENNMVAEAVKFSHTWWQARNGQKKQKGESQVVDFFSKIYLKKKSEADGNLEPIQSYWPLLRRLGGVSQQKLAEMVETLPTEEREEWLSALQSTEKEIPVSIPPEWVAHHTIPFETVARWDAAVSRIREKLKLRFTSADLMNFAVLLAGNIPSIQGVKAREVQFEGRTTEVLDVLHVTSLKQELHQAFNEFLSTGELQFLDNDSLQKKLKFYNGTIKTRATEGKSWASYLGTLTGDGINGLDLSNVVATASKTEVMVGENVVDVITGKSGLLSVLGIPRDVTSYQEITTDLQYHFISANTSVYRPESVAEQMQKTFIGALGVAPGGEWRNGNFEMTGLKISQRLLPDQGYKEVRAFINSYPSFLQYKDEILGALDDSLRISHHNKATGVDHTYNPSVFRTQLISRNVPNVDSIIQRLNRHMEEEYMPQFLQRIELAMNWLLSILEAE